MTYVDCSAATTTQAPPATTSTPEPETTTTVIATTESAAEETAEPATTETPSLLFVCGTDYADAQDNICTNESCSTVNVSFVPPGSENTTTSLLIKHANMFQLNYRNARSEVATL